MRGLIVSCTVVGLMASATLGQSSDDSNAANGSGIAVARQTICTSVADREPVGAGESFRASAGTLVCFTEVNLSGEGAIEHRWIRGDSLIGNPISLEVKGPRWRTHSRKMIPEWMTGAWRVDVVDAATGEVLSSASFVVK